MPDDIATYPPDAGATTYLLTVRGTANAPTLDEARATHNATAGAPQSAAGARSLGDLCHNVFAPINKELDGTAAVHRSLEQPVRARGTSSRTRMSRKPRDSCSPVATGSSGRVSTVSAASPFRCRRVAQPVPSDSSRSRSRRSTTRPRRSPRTRGRRSTPLARTGMVSHTTWLRLPNPGEPATNEIIGVDTWMDADRMNEYYDLSLGFDHFGPVFAGAPETSVWRTAPGEWVEW